MTDQSITKQSPKSWGELVKTVEIETRHKSVLDHPDYKTGIERNVVKSKLNPVQMKFLDENKEREYMTMRLKREMEKCTKDLDLKSKRFDVINHNGPPRKPIPFKKNVNGRVDRDWRLLSLVSEEDHKSLSIFYDESLHEKQKHLNSSMSVPSVDNSVLRRPFNIVSNSFIDNDDLVQVQESKLLKEHIKEKYWQSHNFDPIHSRYFDNKKDQEMKEKEMNCIKLKERKKLASLAPTILSSEGKNYNIIVQEDWANKSDLIKPNQSMVKRDALLARLRNSEEIVSDQVYRGDLNNTINDNRRIHRISHERWRTQINRDFNIVNNQVKESSYLPFVPAPASVWEKVNSYSSSSSRNNNQHNVFSPSPSTQSSIVPSPQTTDRIYDTSRYNNALRHQSTETSRNTDRRQETERSSSSFVPKLAMLNTTIS